MHKLTPAPTSKPMPTPEPDPKPATKPAPTADGKIDKSRFINLLHLLFLLLAPAHYFEWNVVLIAIQDG